MKKLTRSITIILLFLAILFSVYFSALDPQKATVFESQSQTIKLLENCNSYYYKNSLTDSKEIALYEEIREALFYRVENYKINFSNKNIINKITLYVCLDNPFLTLTDNFYTIETSAQKNSFLEQIQSDTLPFVFNDERYYEKMTAAYQKATEIVSNMPKYTNEYDKIKYLHDYIIMHVRYTDESTDKDADTAYGALINGKARCEGYTNAFSILLNLVGIENTKVFYFGEDNDQSTGHIWNLVKINGSYYHVDTTNDSFNSSQDIPSNYVSYAYFLISTNDIKKTSKINEMISGIIPACDSENDNFFLKNGLYFNSYNRLKIGTASGIFLEDQIEQGMVGVSIKFKNAADYNKALSSSEIPYLLSVIAEYANSSSTYFTYYMNDSQQVITFYPQ